MLDLQSESAAVTMGIEDHLDQPDKPIQPTRYYGIPSG